MNIDERINFIRKIKLDLSDAKPNTEKFEDGDMKNPCWDGYEPIGLKDDGSPRCVPINAKKVKEGFPIPSPSGGETQDEYMKRCMGDIGGEYDQDQAVAICIKKYEDK